jgi:DNA-binding response OmpR family regulator
MDELPQAGRGGGVDILVKPYREEDLLARVRKALNGTADASSPPITVVPAL